MLGQFGDRGRAGRVDQDEHRRLAGVEHGADQVLLLSDQPQFRPVAQVIVGLRHASRRRWSALLSPDHDDHLAGVAVAGQFRRLVDPVAIGVRIGEDHSVGRPPRLRARPAGRGGCGPRVVKRRVLGDAALLRGVADVGVRPQPVADALKDAHRMPRDAGIDRPASPRLRAVGRSPPLRQAQAVGVQGGAGRRGSGGARSPAGPRPGPIPGFSAEPEILIGRGQGRRMGPRTGRVPNSPRATADERRRRIAAQRAPSPSSSARPGCYMFPDVR